jgi:hypothetical protein
LVFVLCALCFVLVSKKVQSTKDKDQRPKAKPHFILL